MLPAHAEHNRQREESNVQQGSCRARRLRRARRHHAAQSVTSAGAGAGRDTAGSGWLGLKANEDHIVTGVDQVPLLPAILLLLLGLGFTITAWWREGR